MAEAQFSEKAETLMMPKQIIDFYAWVATEPDGGEGVPAIDIGGGVIMPLVGADRERVESLRPHAMAVCHMLGHPIKLVRFHGIETLESHEPKQRSSRA